MFLVSRESLEGLVTIWIATKEALHLTGLHLAEVQKRPVAIDGRTAAALVPTSQLKVGLAGGGGGGRGQGDAPTGGVDGIDLKQVVGIAA